MDTFIQTEPELVIGLGAILFLWVCGMASDIYRRVRKPARPTRSPFIHWIVTGSLLWLLCGVSLWAWLFSGRSLGALGFTWGQGMGVFAAWGIALGFMALQLAQLPAIRRDAGLQDTLRKSMFGSGDYDALMPRRRRDCWGFFMVAVTAGITEEVIFRAFLISVLALLMPLWVAAVAAVAVFILAHIYQGVQGLMRILPVTIIMTLTYVLSGSLWPGIVVHVVVDVMAGVIAWLLLPQDGYVTTDETVTPDGMRA
ncbi:CPBP family intramembrane metalloprotease [Henriciella barbarensis]|uniref:CPBP family intramembrane metalloprotease n=1 Tax=Henriciella barbarensis TaxID=86342 RepID=A0A399R7G9_9PROT|nr:CPBP family intramembrane glutamic endopeptidase [Henriciella barbarensis]RIJ25827.1 CPBP family intramembrane metalloprotease [Henriciella barbarensis]